MRKLNKVNVLHLGPEDFSEKYPLHPCVEWYYESDFEDLKIRTFDVVILSRQINEDERKTLFYYTKAYCLLIMENLTYNKETLWLYKSKKGQVIDESKLKELLSDGVQDYFAHPYGEKFIPNNLALGEGFYGKIRWMGFSSVSLTGDFGLDFTQIAYWRNNIPVFQGQSIDFWLEYEKTGDIDIKLRITQFRAGSVSEEQNIWEFDEDQLQDIVYITNELPEGPIFVSLLAKGNGELKIIALHDRYSRRGKGAFLPGGERRVTKHREEIFFYFDPGDMKPPLNVYFSGYKTQEGFEGYNMLRRLGSPFLLISESRLEGGAFYLGDQEFEQTMRDGIQHYLDELGFMSNQMTMSGLSMGTFGALFYGCDFKPHSIIVGKPLTSLGDVASNERINRPGGFPTSLDVLWKQYQSLGLDAVQIMNQRFWDKFDSIEWEDTKFIVSYMIEDDYDGTAYPTLLSHINDENIEVFSKGLHGRHNDDTSGIVGWFISQYNMIVKKYFEREFKKEK